MKKYTITLEIEINEQDHHAGAFSAESICNAVGDSVYNKCNNRLTQTVCTVNVVSVVRPTDTIGELENAGKI